MIPKVIEEVRNNAIQEACFNKVDTRVEFSRAVDQVDISTDPDPFARHLKTLGTESQNPT